MWYGNTDDFLAVKMKLSFSNITDHHIIIIDRIILLSDRLITEYIWVIAAY